MSVYIFFSFFFGAAYTYALAPYLGAVIAAASAGLIGSFLSRTELQAAVYTGAFAGMSSDFIVGDYYELAFVSLAGAAILVVLEKRFIGYGGKMGASAFLSVCSLVLLKAALG